MTEPPIIPFPSSPYCRVRARVASIWADGPDDGTHPDWRPAVGEKVSLTPSIGSQLLTYNVAGADPIIVTVERVDCEVDENGWLAKSDGRPVYIAPTDDPLMSATGWIWTATIKGKSVPFSAPAGGTVDLALFVTTPAVPTTPTPTGGSSGVQLVSGTVTLSSSGAPIREFYTTAAATIGGVVFGEGTAVVFRRAPGGQWGYKVVEDWTPVDAPDPDPDPELIVVTVVFPTWTDNAIDGGGTWTTPSITGVSYSPASGTASPGQTVTVTATAQAGYVLSGPSSWSHTFPEKFNTVFLADKFSRADGVLIGTATETGGGTWAAVTTGAMNTDPNAPSPLISGQQVVPSATETVAARLNVAPPVGEFEASMDASNNGTANLRVYLFGYFFMVKSSSVAVYRGATKIGEVSNTAGAVRTVRVVWDGTTATCYVDDTVAATNTGALTDLTGFSMSANPVGATVDNLRVVVP